MSYLRRRNPFEFSDSNVEDDEGFVLDEQEQEEMVERLRIANAAAEVQYVKFVQVLVGLSIALQLVYFLRPGSGTPFHNILASTAFKEPPIPALHFFIMLAVTLHINIFLILRPTTSIQHTEIHPISFQLSYTLAAVPPALCLFLGRSWLTIGWWSVTAAVIFAAETIQDSINEGNESISSLEALKYISPGA